jgi:hypothetical protein
MITARCPNRHESPTIYVRAGRGHCDTGEKLANRKVKTDPTERFANDEEVTCRMYKVCHLLTEIQQIVSPVKVV